MRHSLIIASIISFFSFQLSAQIDQEFWFAAPDLTQGTQGEINGNAFRDRPIQVVLSTLVDPAQITIWQPANLSFAPIVINLAAGSTQNVNLTNWINQIETSQVDSVMNTGILIRATAPITAYYELGAAANRDLIALKGKNANGTLFYTPFQTLWENDQSLGGSPYIPAPRSGFVIVATDDSTNVTITPKIDILNHLAGVPFSIYLNRGQSYYCESIDQTGPAKPAGTKIESDRPIAVLIKDDMIDLNLATDGGADLAADQLISVEQCGFKHIVVRGDLGAPGDKAYVLATEDSTEIFIDGNIIPDTILNTGEQYIYSFTQAAGFIEGSKPIYVLHISGVGDQIAGAIIPSLECTGSTQVGFTRTGSANFKLNLTIKAGSEGSFLLNNNPTLITPADFLPVPGTNGNWVFMRKAFTTAQIPVGVGSLIQNTGDELFHMGITYQQGASCNYGYFTNFSYLELGINSELCLGDSAVLDAGPGKTSYLWSTGDTTQKITVFDAGTYYVDVLSGNECTATDTITVNYYAPPVSIQASRDTICEGSQLLLSVPGVYLFEWQDGSTDPFFIASDSGTYYVIVTDYQGCRAADSITIYTSPRPITPTSVILPFDTSINSDTLCAGESVAMQMSPLENASYAWQGPNNTIFNGQDLTLNNLTLAQSGQYKPYYTVDGCESFFDTLFIQVNPNPEVYIGLSDTLCDVNDIILDAGAGDQYTYLWQDNSTNQTFTVNQDGSYSVVVTNGFECSKSASVTLAFSISPNAPLLSTNGQDVLSDVFCEGEQLSLSVPPVVGNAYYWVLNGDTVSSIGYQYLLSDLLSNQSGMYYAYYYANGCASLSDSSDISILVSPQFDFATNDTIICGTTPYLLSAESVTDVSYVWQDASTDASYLVSSSGEYWVTLTNAIGCSTSDTLNVLYKPFPISPTISGDLSVCDGSNLQLNSNNENGVLYSWNGPGFSNTGASISISNASIVNEGSYTLSAVLDGCISPDIASVNVIIQEQPQFDFTTKDTIICGNTPYLLSAASVSDVSYLWQDASTNATYLVSNSGEYWVTLTNDFGCSTSDSVNVLYKPFPISPTISGDVSVCDGSNLLLNSNNENGVLYSWNGPSFSNSGASISIANASTTNEGSYTLSAVLDGCISPDIASVNVIIQALPQIELGENKNICAGNVISINGPDGMTSYSWSNGTSAQVAELPEGTYTLTISDANGCENQDVITITENGPIASFVSDPSTGSQTGNTITFTDASQGSPISWNWNFGDNNASTNQNTTHIFQSQAVLTITLVVTDAAGCSDTTSREFTVSNSVEVPNSFTPNGDGKNDFFVVKGLEAFPNSKLTVFNRWGNEVFSSNGYTNTWNAEKLPDGVYFYILDLANDEVLKGDVTVLRN